MNERFGKAPSQRQLRMGEDLRHNLSMILERSDFRDPSLKGVVITVTEVRISPDGRNATAFVVPLGGGDSKEMLKGLDRAKGYLRHELARMSTTKYMPKLSFKADQSFDEFGKIDALLHDKRVVQDLVSDDEDDLDDDEEE